MSIDTKSKKLYTQAGGLACQKEDVDKMTGHIVKGALCNDRGVWSVRARVYNPNTGKYKQRTKSTGYKVADHTRRKAERAMRDIVMQWEEEANAKPVLTDPTFAEYVQKWLDKKSLSLRENTMKFYRGNAAVHVLPELGDLKVRDMALSHLQDFYARLLKRLSVKTVRKIHIIIHGAILDAVRDGIISTNFADYVEFPKSEKFEGKAYTTDQISALLNAVEKEGEPIQAVVILAVCYGLRRSEICGLRWEDIDFSTGKMFIRHTITENGSLIIESDRTKTQKSRREIMLIGSTIPYLILILD